MVGWVSGGGYGEVMKQHLTIWNAHKQRVPRPFGEVLTIFSAKSFSTEIAQFVSTFCYMSRMLYEAVSDHL